jgi:hypothetical protein
LLHYLPVTNSCRSQLLEERGALILLDGISNIVFDGWSVLRDTIRIARHSDILAAMMDWLKDVLERSSSILVAAEH